MHLTREKLEPLRERLQAHGQRPSVAMVASTPKELIEAMRLVEEWGPFVEAMYLMMAADRRVLNVEREVLRGALAVLSDEKVRTRHMEAMLDAAMRKVAAEGEEKRLQHVVGVLREDRPRAEAAIAVAAAIAAADQRVVPEEHAMLTRLAQGLGVDEGRAQSILDELGARVP